MAAAEALMTLEAVSVLRPSSFSFCSELNAAPSNDPRDGCVSLE